jgi:DNA-binding NtrC family response regulator
VSAIKPDTKSKLMRHQNTTKRILLVDDDRIIVSLLEAGLEEMEENYLVETTSSGLDALERIAQDEFALVITDYRMPEMNGLELIQKIQDLAPNTRIVLLTAHPAEKMGAIVGNIKIDGYLEKPTSIYKLWEVVRSTLGESPA